MARSKAARRPKTSTSAGRGAKSTAGARKGAGRSAKRPTGKAASQQKTASRSTKAPNRPAVGRKRSSATQRTRTDRKTGGTKARSSRSVRDAEAHPKPSRLNRDRRRLADTVATPPSSLNMNRRGSAARTGRAEIAGEAEEHRGMSRAITGGDVDVDLEDAYFTGDESPGGDNPTPDQDIVDDIGKALGVQYEDNEELKASDKVTERDRHRWELDPASSEDYKDRK
jgi:Family of unknown function (DUF6335)